MDYVGLRVKVIEG